MAQQELGKAKADPSHHSPNAGEWVPFGWLKAGGMTTRETGDWPPGRARKKPLTVLPSSRLRKKSKYFYPEAMLRAQVGLHSRASTKERFFASLRMTTKGTFSAAC